MEHQLPSFYTACIVREGGEGRVRLLRPFTHSPFIGSILVPNVWLVIFSSRWDRAAGLGLDPPQQVRALLLSSKGTNKENSLWEGRV